MYHIIDSWTLNSRSTVQLTPEQSLSDAHIFSISHITDFSCLGTLDSASTLLLLAISNSKIANKKHTSVKKCGIKWPPIYSMRTETRRQSSLVHPQLRTSALGNWSVSPPCTCLQMTIKALWLLILVLKIYFVSGWINKYGIHE